MSAHADARPGGYVPHALGRASKWRKSRWLRSATHCRRVEFKASGTRGQLSVKAASPKSSDANHAPGSPSFSARPQCLRVGSSSGAPWPTSMFLRGAGGWCCTSPAASSRHHRARAAVAGAHESHRAPASRAGQAVRRGHRCRKLRRVLPGADDLRQPALCVRIVHAVRGLGGHDINGLPVADAQAIMAWACWAVPLLLLEPLLQLRRTRGSARLRSLGHVDRLPDQA
jgi:hypothetical protein